jgi:hypothetical protein
MIPSVKDLPPPLDPSASSVLTGEHLKALEALIDQQHKLFGQAKSTKQHAAARMASYLVISAAMGEKPRACAIMELNQNRVAHWGLCVEWDAAYLLTPISQDTDPLTLVKAALHYSAGVTGECLKGLLHQSSSLPDIYRGTICNVLLDYLFELPAGSYSFRLCALGMQILEDNIVQFEELRTRLEYNQHLIEDEAAMIMRTVAVVDMSLYLGGLQ